MLIKTYQEVRPTIVALGSKLVETPPGVSPLYPELIGTGFLVDKSGLVATNSHVAERLMNLPRHPLTGEQTAIAILLTPTVEHGENTGAGVMMISPKSYAIPQEFSCDGAYYGQEIPDIAFIKLKVKNTPFLRLESGPNVIQPGL